MYQAPPNRVSASIYPPYAAETSLNKQKDIYNSHLYNHSKIPTNDRLYDPLRNTVSHPQQITSHEYKHYTEHAAASSHLSHEYRHLAQNQYQHIVDIAQQQKTQTYMADKPLKPTHNVEKVTHKHFYIVDANQKYGNPITESQLRQNMQSKIMTEQIVYQPEQSEANGSHKVNAGQLGSKGMVRSESKYNMYSCLDQPYERVKKSGCGAFDVISCPANQCIASEKKYSWFK